MQYTNVFSQSDLEYILKLPDVVAAQEKLVTTSQVYFKIQLTESIRNAIHTRLGLDMSSISEIPMRWIQGDMAPHVDVGTARFENTYLVYMNDSPGELRIDTSSYPITSNTAFVFNEGISHETRNTTGVPRLLLGPMNEQGIPVGFPVSYFPTEQDALSLNYANLITGGDYTIISVAGFENGYKIASNSTGSSSNTDVYAVGSVLTSGGSYYLYPNSGGNSPACFVNGTRVLTSNGYKAIETLLYKDLIVTPDGRTIDYVLRHQKFATTDTSSAPYRIEAGAFGKNKPGQDICLSPTHKIQIRKGVWISPERAAKVNPKVKQYDVGKPVTYWHIECADYLQDNLVCEGMIVESLGTTKNYKGPAKLYTWSERLGGFTRPASITKSNYYKI